MKFQFLGPHNVFHFLLLFMNFHINLSVKYWFSDVRENCGEKMDQFLKRCFYHSGQYDSQQNFEELDKKLKEHEVIFCLG